MSKRIGLNLIEHSSPTGATYLWTHPDDHTDRYKDLSYWVELAQLLERAKFDTVFFPDALGVLTTYQNSSDVAVREAMSVPKNDPTYFIPAMASVTSHLGFTVTCSITYDHPYSLARKMTTLDHLTDGRIAWNVVTSNLKSAALNFGLTDQLDHDVRYDRGDEFLEVCYKLWERSWEDDAVIRDRQARIYTDPSKVHDIQHEGKFFRVPGIHLCEPSAQRTPVLFQAGSSERGREFAAKHAECIFLNAITSEETKFLTADIRRRAEQLGRDPKGIKFYPRLLPVMGTTEEEAKERLADYLSHVSTEGTLALVSSWTGIDLSAYKEEELLQFLEKRGSGTQHTADSLHRYDKDKKWTLAELAKLFAFGGLGGVTAGTPEQIADYMERFIDETDVDGFNISYMVRPSGIVEFAEQVVPILQNRGRVQTEYQTGTLRHKLFGSGNQLPADHPGKQVQLFSIN
ncbi:LLM class flavin-dependent oxidoreductase [Paenibacillus periandrae]|uniref:LLM class flavin-dependent oxidoreductase n=1 Tax=Paenibacillus periandrae TaxID=1761741 RepID=UPI001F0984FE|nr:LLM class flavin-dependent oxidoreductase [Paenibacillus periandrae]